MIPSLNGAARPCGLLLLALVLVLASIQPLRAQALTGWQNADIGAVSAAGSASQNGASFILNGSGADIWNGADEFHFAYQAWSGDGEFVARVTGLTNTHGWAKAGVMIRESLQAESRHALACVNPAGAPTGVFRSSTGGASSFAPAYENFSPMWVKLVRVNTLFTAYYSLDGTNWRRLGSQTLELPTTVYVGLAVTSHDDGVICRADFDQVAFRASNNPTPAAPSNLTATAAGNTVTLRWTDNSSDETRFQIEKSTDNNSFAFDGFVGANVTEHTSRYLEADTTYYFRVRSQITESTYAYSNVATATTGSATLNAPGLVATAVSSQQIDLRWTDGYSSETGFELYQSADGVGFSLITTTAPDVTTYAVNGLAPSTWYYFRVRAVTAAGPSPYSDSAPAQTQSGPPGPPAGPAAPTSLSAVAAAGAINLSWTDNASDETGFHCERSVDNVNFFSIATLGANAASHADAAVESGRTYYYRVRAVAGLATSAYSNVASATAATGSVAGSSPSSWSSAEIGAVGAAGSSSTAGSEITVAGAGSDIWGAADAFHFAQRTWAGDGQFIVRVEDMDATHAWAKAGVMFRESLSPGAANAFVYLTPINGAGFQARSASGGATTFARGPWWASTPFWVKLTRQGNVFTAHASADGASWSLVGSATIAMPASIHVGFAVTSHNSAIANVATFMEPALTP